MEPTETIMAYLKRKLREAGSARWKAIAAETAVKQSLIRKIAYDDRENPGVTKIQPLVTYFKQVELGERSLPEPETPAEPQTNGA